MNQKNRNKISWEEKNMHHVPNEEKRAHLLGRGARKVRYTLWFNAAESLYFNNCQGFPLPPSSKNSKYVVFIEYGEFNYSCPVLANEKLRNFSIEEAKEFCQHDYTNYLEQTELKWARPIEFNPLPSILCELVGINSKNKARYEIHSIKPTEIPFEDFQAGRKFFAKKISGKLKREKILNPMHEMLFTNTPKLLTLAACEKLCEKDYEKSIDNCSERI